jgi:hypothetical protein
MPQFVVPHRVSTCPSLSPSHPAHSFIIGGFGWRIHCGVEVTESSTNKQHTLSPGVCVYCCSTYHTSCSTKHTHRLTVLYDLPKPHYFLAESQNLPAGHVPTSFRPKNLHYPRALCPDVNLWLRQHSLLRGLRGARKINKRATACIVLPTIALTFAHASRDLITEHVISPARLRVIRIKLMSCEFYLSATPTF